MKPSIQSLSAWCFTLTVSANTLLAQPYSLDKYGNGTSTIYFSMPPSVTVLPFEVAPDPTGGITTAPVLIYSLGAQVVSGDVALMEPDGTTVASLLRFFTPTGMPGKVIYYSQVDGSLAGVGIPPTVDPVKIPAVDPETLWNPGGGQPGAGYIFPVFLSFRYSILSQSLPPKPPIYLSGTNIIWNFTNGFPAMQFVVIAATNASLPLATWTRVSTNLCDQAGSFKLVLPVCPDKPCLFYRLAVPLQ